MDTGMQEGGRANQRRRTRDALIAAAAALLEEGRTPTVPEVADRARVSRATAYRYFPSQAALVSTAGLQAVADRLLPAELERIGALPDPGERIDALVAAVRRFTTDHDRAFRTMLSAALDPAATTPDAIPGRQGNRVRWIEEALGPEPPAGSAARRRLVAALALLTGIETSIVLHDVCGLDPDEADEVARWAARALVRAAAAEGG